MTFPLAVFADDLGLARLSMIEGDVQVLIQDTTDWTEATINLPLNERDRIWVRDVYGRLQEECVTRFGIASIRDSAISARALLISMNGITDLRSGATSKR